MPDGAVPASRGAAPQAASPLFAWIEAPQIIEHAMLSDDGRSLLVDGQAIELAITPKIPTNWAYVDASTVRFFPARSLSRCCDVAMAGRLRHKDLNGARCTSGSNSSAYLMGFLAIR